MLRSNRSRIIIAMAGGVLGALSLAVLLGPGGGQGVQAAAGTADTGSASAYEYDRALDELIACATGAGLVVDASLPREGLREPRVRFAIPDADGTPDQETLESGRAALAKCRNDFPAARPPVGGAKQPSPEELEGLVDRLLKCVANSPTAEPGNVGWVSFVHYIGLVEPIPIEPALLPAYASCALAEEARSGLNPPLPSGLVTGSPEE